MFKSVTGYIFKVSLFLFALMQIGIAQMIAENALVQLGEHTYAIPDNNVSAVPNVGIIIGTEATLIIDPGLGRENGEIVLEEARRLSDNEQFYIATTHYHPEHTTGYLAFPDSAIYINSTTQEDEFVEDGNRVIELFASRTPVMGRLLADAERRIADITFESEYSLDLGGVNVRMVLVGPTHTRGDTGIFVEEDRVLFSGDVVMNNSFLSANENSSISKWLMAFDTFGSMDPAAIVPAHGDLGNGSLIQVQRYIVGGIRDRVLALKEQGENMESAAGKISTELQEAHPEWPRANGIAALARSAWLEQEQ